MIKLTVLYRRPADLEAFETFYNANLALMEQLPGVIRREASMIMGAPGGESDFYRMLELYFDDFDAFDAAMRSPAGDQAGKHLMAHAAELSELFFAEVYEEAGGSTPDTDAGETGDPDDD